MIKRAAMFTVVLAMVAPAAAVAQTSDFSGTWQLESQITPVSAPVQGAAPGTRATIARSGAAFNRGAVSLSGRFGRIRQFMRSRPADHLVITQSSTELAVEEHWTPSIEGGAYHRSLRYRLDGSDSTNPFQGGEWTTTSSWDGDTLVTMGTREQRGRRSSTTIEVQEVRSLSGDGQMLTVETIVTSEGSETKNTLIFKRVTS